jgi:hypothetical protein
MPNQKNLNASNRNTVYAKATADAQNAYYDPSRPQCAYVPPPEYYESPPAYTKKYEWECAHITSVSYIMQSICIPHLGQIPQNFLSCRAFNVTQRLLHGKLLLSRCLERVRWLRIARTRVCWARTTVSFDAASRDRGFRARERDRECSSTYFNTSIRRWYLTHYMFTVGTDCIVVFHASLLLYNKSLQMWKHTMSTITIRTTARSRSTYET